MRGDRDRPKMHRFSCVYQVKFCDRSLCQQNLALTLIFARTRSWLASHTFHPHRKLNTKPVV